MVGSFGSFASEKNTVYSDIDVAIKSGYDYFNDVEFLKNLIRKKFYRNIDITKCTKENSFKM